jgi:hypothetical protein
MRRVAVGNVIGAKRVWEKNPTDSETLARYESGCICNIGESSAVEIRAVVQYLEGRTAEEG